jgi:hypothetical protein
MQEKSAKVCGKIRKIYVENYAKNYVKNPLKLCGKNSVKFAKIMCEKIHKYYVEKIG